MNKRSFFRDGIVTGLVILFLFLLLVSSKTEAATTRSGVWRHNDNGWWYVFDDDKSYARNMWVTIKGYDYYFLDSGFMAASQYVDGKWVNSNGQWETARTGGKWKKNKTGWWYTDESGYYPTSCWLTIQFKQYYFNKEGYCILNSWVGDRYVDKDGVYIPGALKLKGVSVASDAGTITTWDKASIKVTKTPANYPNADLVWTSSDPSVATVNGNGMVTPVKTGSVTISVGSKYPDGAKASCQLTIKAVSVSSKDMTILMGGSKAAEVTWNTSGMTNTAWSSADSSIAKVSSNGQVEGVKPGSTKITITAAGPDGKTVSSTFSVTVNSYLKFKTKEENLTVVDQKTLQYDSKGIESESEITWVSSDPLVVGIQNGTLKPLKPGKATITAGPVNGIGDTVTVNVTEAIIVGKMSLILEDKEKLPFTAKAENAAYSYRSGNPSVATVSTEGIVTAAGIGETKVFVTVTGKSGLTKEYPVEVEVIDVDRDFERIQILDKDKKELTDLNLTVGETYDLNVNLKKSGSSPTYFIEAGDEDQKTATGWIRLAWSTNTQEDTIISLDRGHIQANGEGSVDVTVSIPQTNIQSTVTVTVKPARKTLKSVKISYELSKYQGDPLDANKIYDPLDADDIELQWKTDDPDVAKVDKFGRLQFENYGGKAGKTVVRVYNAEGTELGNCTVYSSGWKDGTNGRSYMKWDGSLLTGWQTIQDASYYFRNDGIMQTGWLDVQGHRYYLGNDGIKRTGRVQEKGHTYFLGSDGIMRTGWVKENGHMYFFDPNGWMVTGWKKISGKWYYFKKDGIRSIGWTKVGNKWYYMDNGTGAMKTGWVKIGTRRSSWYYLDPKTGVMKTGWLRYKNKWYYMSKTSGQMSGAWFKIGKKWYYTDPKTGIMKTGWLKYNGSWYYLDPSGGMVTGTVRIGKETYRFDRAGKWIP